jgi:ATP-dependent RNA helicase DeaD
MIPAQQRILSMTDFTQFGLPEKLNATLINMNYTAPTPIQLQAIPLALEGRDVLGSAQTGTGKTGAFGIPMVAKVLSSPRGNAIVLTPTRELAAQVMTIIQQLLGKRSFIHSTLLIGGDPMPPQTASLRLRPRIIVGTPGRINDHLERGNLILHDTNFLVLDETDRMLDMGFGIQIDKIIKFLPAVRQTLMFSATLPPEIVKMSSKYLNNPARVSAGQVNVVVPRIKQETMMVDDEQKYPEMLKQLTEREGSIIVFVKTKRSADRIAEKLNKQGHRADTIHGDLHQRRREKVIQAFRDKKFRILVATDIAARGLDIPHIEHVLNFDLPQAPEDYIHRIGRTGRNGSEGSAINLVCPADHDKWRAIHRLLYPKEAPLVLPRGAAGEGRPRTGKRPASRDGQRPRSGNGAPKGEGQGAEGAKRSRPFRRFPKKAASA